MFLNYFNVALRNLRNSKTYTLISIIGLSIGVACCIAIMLFVRDELTYDRYNEHADQIYRPTMSGMFNGREVRNALSPAPMGAALFRDFPEVAGYARLYYEGSHMIRYRKKAFVEDKFLWGDSALFDVFTLPFVVGNPATALTQPRTVVISQSTARKYFGDENPLGKTLEVEKTGEYMITGVIKDVPENSHFHPDFIASMTSVQDSRSPNWLGNEYYTYLLLRKGTNPGDFQRKLNREVITRAGPQLKALTGMSMDRFLSAGNKVGYLLQPLTSIHLNSHLDYELEANGDISRVYVFSAIAFAILLIACINFVNLATARSEKRAKEVGIRKTLGASHLHLLRQFLAESVLMSGIAVILAVGLVEMLLPLLNNMADKHLNLHLTTNPWSFPALVLLVIAVGTVAGAYPAFYLSSFRPVDVFKPGWKRGRRRFFLRNGLVVFQFVISISLFIGTLVIYEQLRYVQTRQLGFDREGVLVVNRAEGLGERIKSFEQELAGNKDVISATNSSAIPGHLYNDSVFWLEGSGFDKVEDLQTLRCDFDFAATYKLQMVQGRFFSREHPSDSNAVVVNEEVLKTFGTRHILGKRLVLPGRTMADERRLVVVGVVMDFNFHSLHEAIRPLVMSLLPRTWGPGSFMTIRLAPGNHPRTISFIGRAWKKYAGDEEFNYNFLNDRLQNLYVEDQRTDKIAGIFSGLAIFIACLGLLGLAAFTAEQRTKEIGIRKVVGASVPEVVALLSAQFVKWVLLANIVAWPLAYYVMNNWLKNFAYRTGISPWLFIVSGALATVIALATVSSYAIRAATANPVEALRYE